MRGAVNVSSGQWRLCGLLLALALAGVALRVVVMAVSYGSNDMANWQLFAQRLVQDGLPLTYERIPRFNHPPLVALMAVATNELSTWSGIPFRLMWKLHELLADLFALWLLWRHFRPRGPLWAALAVAIFACNPVSIAVTAFHGNTDSLCAVLALYAALLYDRGKFIGAGLALAAAINVKVIALLLVPGGLLLAATPLLALRFALGLTFGALPIWIGLLELPGAFYRNVFGYASQVDAWGVNAWALRSRTVYPELYQLVTVEYRALGKAIIVGLTLALAALARHQRWSAVRLNAATIAMFLFLTPGFGVQYLVWLVPLLAAASLRYSIWWALLAGAFLVLTYHSFLTAEWPLTSLHGIPIREPMATLGLFAWALLGHYLYHELTQTKPHHVLIRDVRHVASSQRLAVRAARAGVESPTTSA
jgi:hypothetical protein